MHLFKLKTYHEVVDEIYYQVKHLEPWERGSRKTAGQTGMCGGVGNVLYFTSFFLLLNLNNFTFTVVCVIIKISIFFCAKRYVVLVLVVLYQQLIAFYIKCIHYD